MFVVSHKINHNYGSILGSKCNNGYSQPMSGTQFECENSDRFYGIINDGKMLFIDSFIENPDCSASSKNSLCFELSVDGVDSNSDLYFNRTNQLSWDMYVKFV